MQINQVTDLTRLSYRDCRNLLEQVQVATQKKVSNLEKGVRAHFFLIYAVNVL